MKDQSKVNNISKVNDFMDFWKVYLENILFKSFQIIKFLFSFDLQNCDWFTYIENNYWKQIYWLCA